MHKSTNFIKIILVSNIYKKVEKKILIETGKTIYCLDNNPCNKENHVSIPMDGTDRNDTKILLKIVIFPTVTTKTTTTGGLWDKTLHQFPTATQM